MAKKDTNALSWRLRRARDEMGITQIDMCNRIVEIVRRSEPNFSMSPAAYNKIETGDTATPKLAVLIACKQILGISLDELIAGETIDTEQQHPFLHDESYVIAKLADDMMPYHRRFMRLMMAFS